jgi:hypothetical protein
VAKKGTTVPEEKSSHRSMDTVRRLSHLDMMSAGELGLRTEDDASSRHVGDGVRPNHDWCPVQLDMDLG